MSRALVLSLLVAGATLVACGGGSSDGPSDRAPRAGARSVAPGAALSLEGARWIGGRGQVIDADRVAAARARAGRERIVAFVRLDDPASERLLRSLAELVVAHPDLVVLGATTSLDADALEAVRARTGAAFPVLLGVSRASRDAWGCGPEACVRVADADDAIVGRSLVQVFARLEPPPRPR
ncbi:MAG: hypothetical protein U1E39_05175 [Planctomycetota bacterium]